MAPHTQLISMYPHLLTGQKNEGNLFFALRLLKQKHQRKRKSHLERMRKRNEKIADDPNLNWGAKSTRQRVLDMVNNPFFYIDAFTFDCTGYQQTGNIQMLAEMSSDSQSESGSDFVVKISSTTSKISNRSIILRTMKKLTTSNEK